MVSSTLSDKIKHSLAKLTELHGISEAELCRKTNISQATLWRLFNGETDPRASTLQAIATYFQVSMDQLLGNQPITTIDKHPSNSVIFIPVFSLEKTDELTEMLHKVSPSNWNHWLDVESTISRACFAVQVTGESMWPLFIEGVLIIIDPDLKPQNKHYVLCQQHKSKEIVFRQYLEDGEEKLLKPINHVYKTTPLHPKDHLFGVVIQSKNKLIK